MPRSWGARTVSGTQWADFGVRTLSALVLGPLVLFALWRGDDAWDLLLSVAFVGLGVEWALLTAPRGNLTVILPAGLLGVQAAELWLGFPAAIVVLVVLTVLLTRLSGRFVASGAPYIGIGCLALLWLRQDPVNGWIDTAFLVSVVWSTDIGAYVAGRWIGGPRLAPRISPGKTWSGAVGGLLVAGWVGWLFALAASSTGAVGGFLAAVGISVVAQAGDLLESAIKRKLGVKDSGRTIPGHGGLLDRLDGILTAAPLAAILAFAAQGGLPLWR
jgi:phosphatidate cytidylyltransferase